ncbi:MAG: hypothetical protein K2W95_30170 [Candidatus Obscuribacterales bacterium]|nr:hypothetical protein [Candidatus Obscuribacterales bacterium]
MFRKNLIVATLIAGAAIFSRQSPTVASDSKPEPVLAKIRVHAKPEIVLDSIRHLRQDEPPGVKCLSHSQHEQVIEETFVGLPVVGKATCVYKECYEPPNKVVFHMLESDKLKSFDGFWQLTPVGPNITEVELATGVDFGIHLPFARQITNTTTLKSIRQQLADVKKLAETKQQAALQQNSSM